MDEFAMLLAWQAGDSDAGGRLLRRHAATVYHFFFTKTDTTTAEELTQETFEACARQRARIAPPATVRAYLLAIARHKLLQHRDEWRRRGSRHESLQHSVDGGKTSPSVALARNAQQQLVVTALQHLPLDCQIVVELHYWEELTVAEIAHVLEVPAGTVKSRLFRARRLLTERLGALAGDPAVAAAVDLDASLSAMQARAPSRGDAWR